MTWGAGESLQGGLGVGSVLSHLSQHLLITVTRMQLGSGAVCKPPFISLGTAGDWAFAPCTHPSLPNPLPPLPSLFSPLLFLVSLHS